MLRKTLLVAMLTFSLQFSVLSTDATAADKPATPTRAKCKPAELDKSGNVLKPAKTAQVALSLTQLLTPKLDSLQFWSNNRTAKKTSVHVFQDGKLVKTYRVDKGLQRAALPAVASGTTSKFCLAGSYSVDGKTKYVWSSDMYVTRAALQPLPKLKKPKNAKAKAKQKAKLVRERAAKDHVWVLDDPSLQTIAFMSTPPAYVQEYGKRELTRTKTIDAFSGFSALAGLDGTRFNMRDSAAVAKARFFVGTNKPPTKKLVSFMTS